MFNYPDLYAIECYVSMDRRINRDNSFLGIINIIPMSG